MVKKKYRDFVLPVEKIAKIKTADLPIEHHKGEPEEHYVFVREYDKVKQVYKVNVCTHLDKYDKGKKEYVLNKSQLLQVKNGNTYPVPIHCADFPSWTGIKREVYEVPKGKMYSWNCAKFKRAGLAKSFTTQKLDGFYSPTLPTVNKSKVKFKKGKKT